MSTNTERSSEWADETAHLTSTANEVEKPADAETLTSIDGQYTVGAGEWQNLPDRAEDDLMVINMGPQHPSTHGVLRMLLTLDGEYVLDNQPVIGYLHTGIEKNAEFRPWVQGVTFVTRMDYLSPFFNELGYCMAVEKLLGISDQIPARAQAIRVMMTELNRITSHQIALATGGMELGAISAMTYGFRDREYILDIFEYVTGLRMNHAYIRPGGVAQDVPEDWRERVSEVLEMTTQRINEMDTLLTKNRLWIERNSGIGVLTEEECLNLGITGPVLRATGLAQDLRKTNPYCGFEQYEFDVMTADTCDAYGRFLIRLGEMRESVKIVEQIVETMPDGPVMVEDKKIAWPAQMALGPDGMGNAPEYIGKIMGQSMESLIHHFKLVTEGFHVPAGQAYASIEAARGEMGFHLTSDGSNKPYRLRVREPSFIHIGAIPMISRGLAVADVIAAVASLDPVMGGVDR